MEDILKLFEQFEEDGYVIRLCPECGEYCEPVELDSASAFCPNCDKSVKVKQLI